MANEERTRIPDLDNVYQSDRYWRKVAHESADKGDHSTALLCMEQVANAWKNAAYAMADQRDALKVFRDFCVRLHYARLAMDNAAIIKVLDEIDSLNRKNDDQQQRGN